MQSKSQVRTQLSRCTNMSYFMHDCHLSGLQSLSQTWTPLDIVCYAQISPAATETGQFQRNFSVSFKVVCSEEELHVCPGFVPVTLKIKTTGREITRAAFSRLFCAGYGVPFCCNFHVFFFFFPDGQQEKTIFSVCMSPIKQQTKTRF